MTELFQWIVKVSWQASVLILLVLFFQWALKSHLSPRWRYALWWIVVLRLCFPVLPSSPLSLYNLLQPGEQTKAIVSHPNPSPTAIMSRPVPDAPIRKESHISDVTFQEPLPAPKVDLPIGKIEDDRVPTVATEDSSLTASESIHWNVQSITVGIWAIGGFLFGILVIGLSFRLFFRLRESREIDDTELQQVLNDCCSLAGIRCRPKLIESRMVSSPCVYGTWVPRLVLPSNMIRQFDAEELRLVFFHELAHLKRGDIQMNWLLVGLQILHWFNPLLWFAFHRMRTDRELAADELALEWAGEKQSVYYGHTLLKVLKTISSPRFVPGTVAILESKAQLKKRFQAIAQFGMVRRWKWTSVLALLFLACLGLTDAKIVKPQESAKTEGEPSAQRRFELQTILHETAEPVQNVEVKVTVERYGGEKEMSQWITDAEGKCEVTYNPKEIKELSYTFYKNGFLPMQGIWKKQQIDFMPDRLEIPMSRGKRIGGQVVDEEGKPIEGAEIVVNETHGFWVKSSRDNYLILDLDAGERLAVTDSDGMWDSRCLWPTVKWLRLRISHKDYADEIYSTEITQAMEGEGSEGLYLDFDKLENHEAQFVLQKGFAVAGTVVDENGLAIPSARIKWFDRFPEHTHQEVASFGELKTGPAGDFYFPHLPSKQIRFAVQAEGYAPFMHEMKLTQDVADLQFALDQGGLLEVEITDRGGQPIPGVELHFEDWSIWQGIDWKAGTDENGRVVWPNAPEEKFQVHLEKEGIVTTARTLQGGQKRTIELDRTLKIMAQVVDAETKEPIEKFKVAYADRESYLVHNRQFAMAGQNGRMMIDLNKLHADSWAHNYFYTCILEIMAPGYMPVTSREFSTRDGDQDVVECVFELERARIRSGVVFSPDGLPLQGVEIALAINTHQSHPLLRSKKISISDKPKISNLEATLHSISESNGHFNISWDDNAEALVAVHESGIASVSIEEFDESGKIFLQKWGKIEGTAWNYDEQLEGAEIWMNSQLGMHNLVQSDRRTQTDSNGEFGFNFIPPGKYRIHKMIPMHRGTTTSGPAETVFIGSGELQKVRIGDQGRPVVGKINVMNPYVPIDWRATNDRHRVGTIPPKPPESLVGREDYNKWRQSEKVQMMYDKQRSHPIVFQTDGSFRIDEMIPGKYQFSINIQDPRDPDDFSNRFIAHFTETFKIPETDQSNSTVPYDIGNFEIWLKPELEEGQTEAPEFTARGIHTDDFKLSDFRGKYVVLDFWATWCSPCIAEFPYLRKVHEQFGNRDDFVLIGLSVDKDISKPASFISENDMPWLQGYVGELRESDVPKRYDVGGIPATFLIDPEGRIIGKDLREHHLLETVQGKMGIGTQE